MDPTVPSSKKFLRQLPGYKPTQQEQKYEQDLYHYHMGGAPPPGHPLSNTFNYKKNELVEQEQYILNLVKFEFDTYPLFFDIVELFMSQGVMFTNDQITQDSKLVQLKPDLKSVTLMEKYIDFFSLLSL